uniref:PNPLA domain-containing protein n=1 Tax=Magallana gigas TaxID=29159 RepID=A0A8W8JBB5_MAGGI
MVTGVLADRHPVKLHLFRTYEEPPNSETDHRFHCPKSYKEQKVWEAARATSAAPSYFKSFENYIDGGLSANNPTLDLLTEFHKQNRHPKKSIGVVVSIGTGKTDFQKASNHDPDLSLTPSPYAWQRLLKVVLLTQLKHGAE